MRKPDRPGSYRVVSKGGRLLLSGVRSDGQRVKMWVKDRNEGDTLGRSLFGSSSDAGIGPIQTPIPPPVRHVDEWGFPVKISPEVAASVAQSFGIKPTPTTPGPVQPPAPDDKEEKEKKERRAKHAKSLMELAGVGWAGGTVMVSNRWVKGMGKEPVKVNPRQVNDLADSTRDTLIEWFGDRDIKPWHMMLILTLGIPMSMYLQSPKSKEQLEKEAREKAGAPNLKAVP